MSHLRSPGSRPLLATLLAATAVWLAAPGGARVATVRVAVAADFERPLVELAGPFTARTGIVVRPTAGATGKLAAQIEQGAPWDVFLAADAARPQRLVARGLAVRSSRFTYARGRLVLWTPRPGLRLGPETLRHPHFTHLAIADPESAPYGAAARAVLRRLGVELALAERLVRGESIGQTYAFVASGAADLGFVSLSQVAADPRGSRWLVPQALHPPLDQQAVLLAHAADPGAARAFLAWLRSAPARAVIRRFGFEQP